MNDFEKIFALFYSVVDLYFTLPVTSAGKIIFINNQDKQKTSVSIPIDAVEKHVLPFLNSKMMNLHSMKKEDFEKCQEEFFF